MTWEEYGKTEDPNILFLVVEERFEPGCVGEIHDAFTTYDEADKAALDLAREFGDDEEEPVTKQEHGRYLVGTQDDPSAVITVQGTWLCGVGNAENQ